MGETQKKWSASIQRATDITKRNKLRAAAPRGCGRMDRHAGEELVEVPPHAKADQLNDQPPTDTEQEGIVHELAG